MQPILESPEPTSKMSSVKAIVVHVGTQTQTTAWEGVVLAMVRGESRILNHAFHNADKPQIKALFSADKENEIVTKVKTIVCLVRVFLKSCWLHF